AAPIARLSAPWSEPHTAPSEIQCRVLQTWSKSVRRTPMVMTCGRTVGAIVQPARRNSEGSGYSTSLFGVAGRGVPQHDRKVGCAQNARIPGKYELLNPNPRRVPPGGILSYSPD